MNPFRNKHWIRIHADPGEEDQSKPEKGPFWRKQANASKHGARLRGCGATKSDGDSSQTTYVDNGKKGYNTTTNHQIIFQKYNVWSGLSDCRSIKPHL